jgi:hypothetical protein
MIKNNEPPTAVLRQAGGLANIQLYATILAFVVG